METNKLRPIFWPESDCCCESPVKNIACCNAAVNPVAYVINDKNQAALFFNEWEEPVIIDNVASVECCGYYTIVVTTEKTKLLYYKGEYFETIDSTQKQLCITNWVLIISDLSIGYNNYLRTSSAKLYAGKNLVWEWQGQLNNSDALLIGNHGVYAYVYFITRYNTNYPYEVNTYGPGALCYEDTYLGSIFYVWNYFLYSNYTTYASTNYCITYISSLEFVVYYKGNEIIRRVTGSSGFPDYGVMGDDDYIIIIETLSAASNPRIRKAIFYWNDIYCGETTKSFWGESYTSARKYGKYMINSYSCLFEGRFIEDLTGSAYATYTYCGKDMLATLTRDSLTVYNWTLLSDGIKIDDNSNYPRNGTVFQIIIGNNYWFQCNPTIAFPKEGNLLYCEQNVTSGSFQSFSASGDYAFVRRTDGTSELYYQTQLIFSGNSSFNCLYAGINYCVIFNTNTLDLSVWLKNTKIIDNYNNYNNYVADEVGLFLYIRNSSYGAVFVLNNEGTIYSNNNNFQISNFTQIENNSLPFGYYCRLYYIDPSVSSTILNVIIFYDGTVLTEIKNRKNEVLKNDFLLCQKNVEGNEPNLELWYKNSCVWKGTALVNISSTSLIACEKYALVRITETSYVLIWECETIWENVVISALCCGHKLLIQDTNQSFLLARPEIGLEHYDSSDFSLTE
jgi:hypothetical protein